MAKQVNCNFCGYRGETVAMVLVGSYFKCPECKATAFDNEDGDDSFIRLFKRHQKEYISRSFQPGTKITGGGESTGKPKKETMKKQSTTRLKFNMDSPRYS